VFRSSIFRIFTDRGIRASLPTQIAYAVAISARSFSLHLSHAFKKTEGILQNGDRNRKHKVLSPVVHEKTALLGQVSQSRVSGWMKLPTRILHDERFALNADGTKPCVDQCVSSSIYATPFLRYGIPRKQSSTVMMPYRLYERHQRDTDGYRRECTCMGDCFVLNDTIYRFRTAAPMILT